MNADIAGLIEDVVRRRFADSRIETVSVREETDHDGAAVFRVTVIFEGPKGLDAAKTSSIVRHVRHELLDRGEEAFPIFAFVSKSDAAGMKAAAA